MPVASLAEAVKPETDAPVGSSAPGLLILDFFMNTKLLS